jgi:SAM-dependent methyltransferase
MATSRTWQLERDAAERYERILVPAILGPVARVLVNWTDLSPGESVLDAGCGTGAAARVAAERAGPTGRVIGIDINSGMVEVARSLPRNDGAEIEWRVESVYAPTLPEGTLDAALCAQTLQFLDRREAALVEMRRVLRENGRLTVSCWCAIEENPYFHALVDAVSRHIGSGTAAGLAAAFGLSNLDMLRSLLTGAGLRDVEIETATLDLELPPLTEFVPRHVSATPMAAGFGAASEEARQAVIDEIVRAFGSKPEDGPRRVPFRTYLARGTR